MDKRTKAFDCVEWVRRVRAEIDRKYEALTLAERAQRMNENARTSALRPPAAGRPVAPSHE